MYLTPRDRFRVLWLIPVRAFSAKAISVLTLTILLAIAIYELTFYLAHVVAGNNLSNVFRVFGLAPAWRTGLDGWLPRLICVLGAVAAVYVLMLGMVAAASFVVRRLRGDRFATLTEAVRFAASRATQIAYCELSMIVFMLFILALFALAGLIGRIPLLGELLYALTMIFPVFFVALISVFVAVVIGVSILLLPAVGAWEEKGETFQAIVETFAVVVRQPFRWLGFTAYSLIAGKVVSFVYAYFGFRALQFMAWAFGLTDGGIFERLLTSGLSHLPVNGRLISSVTSLLPGAGIDIALGEYAVSAGSGLASHLAALMLFIIIVSVIAFLLNVVVTGQVYAYGLIRGRMTTAQLDDEALTTDGVTGKDTPHE